MRNYEKITFLPIICFLLMTAHLRGDTPLTHIRPDVLSAAETQHARELSEAFHHEKWQDGIPAFQKLIVLYRDKMMPENFTEEPPKNIPPGVYIPVSAFLQKILDAYADRMPEDIHTELQKKWAFFDGGEIPAKNPRVQNFPPTDGTKNFRATMTRIFDETGTLLYQDTDTPEELWKSLLPADTRGIAVEETVDVTEISFPGHLFYSPKTRVLFARMGTPVSVWEERQRDRRPQGYLIALDMRAEGRLLWKKRPDSTEWSFAGNPLADEKYVYVPMIRQTSPPEFHLAAMNLRDGTYAWRRFLFTASADSSVPMIFHLPIFQDETHLSAGTKNLGVEVVLRKSEGKIMRMNLYDSRDWSETK